MTENLQPSQLADRTREGVARLFRQFGEVEAPAVHSPLYAELAVAVAEDPELLELARLAPAQQPPPNLLFASVHYLLLAGTDHPLAAYYPMVRAGVRPREPAYALFRAFCAAHRERLAALIQTRLTQTNVVRRCTALLPAFASLREVRDHPSAPTTLALLELGPSAGLNLLWDRYHYDYGQGRSWGPADSPVQLRTELRGEHRAPLPQAPLGVSWRRGIDIAPVDVLDDDALRWLEALIFPEHVERRDRLRAAVELARQAPPTLIRGDAVALLPSVLAKAPDDAALCVFASHVLYQFPVGAIHALDEVLRQHGRSRPVSFISMESTGHGSCALRLSEYARGERRTRRLARANAHGHWLEWSAGEPDGGADGTRTRNFRRDKPVL